MPRRRSPVWGRFRLAGHRAGRARFGALLVWIGAALPGLTQSDGRISPVPVGPYLDGVFPSATPGSAGTWHTPRAFPNLTFTDPIWMTPWPGSGEFLLVERAGRLKRFPDDQSAVPSDVEVVLDWRGRTQRWADEGGMYGAAFHPRFADEADPQRFLFICYTHQLVEGTNRRNGEAYWRLTRIEFDAAGAAIPGSEMILMSLYDPHKWHNGGAMFFGADGFLHLTNGDGGRSSNYYENGQVLDKSLFGVVMRIDVDQRGGEISHPIRRQPREVATAPAGTAPSYTQNYYIPNDNPWVQQPGPAPGEESLFLEEIVACGLRSPHSMHRDPVSGQVWIGDVGQGSREELDMFIVDPARPIAAGEGPNFGWGEQEGNLGPDLDPTAPGRESRPVFDYDRTAGGCVISGGVYRGSLHASDLTGKVIFGDNLSARIWSLEYGEGLPPVVTELTRLSDGGTLDGGHLRGLTNICRSSDGELYFLYARGPADPGGRIYRLEAGPSVPEPPALLSQTGAFTDLRTLTPAPALLPYTVASPLWSDRSLKARWIALPNDGFHDTAAEVISYRDDENWTFPAGTVFVKHFELPADAGDPTATVRLETRFLVCLEGGRKYGVTYRWRPDGLEADLLDGAATAAYEVTLPDRSTEVQTWQFPSRSDCLACHNAAAGQALGVRTHQLNGWFTYPDSQVRAHQLRTWNALGMFDVRLESAQIDGALQAAGLADSRFPLEHRVRSYLDANCAHCHRPGGKGPGFDGRLVVPLRQQKLVNEPLRPDLQGRFDLDPGTSDDGQVIPGDVLLSAVHFRLAHAQPDPAAMPPIAKNLVDPDAVSAVASWISGLTAAEFAEPAPVRVQLGGPAAPVGGVFPVIITFDQAVEDFDALDLVVTNGAVVDLQGSGGFYSARIRPTGSPATVQVPADAVNGPVSGSRASNVLVVSHQSTLPPEVLTFQAIEGSTVGGLFQLSLFFNEAVRGLDTGRIVVTNGDLVALTGSGSTYALTVAPYLSGRVTVRIEAEGLADAAGVAPATDPVAVVNYVAPAILSVDFVADESVPPYRGGGLLDPRTREWAAMSAAGTSETGGLGPVSLEVGPLQVTLDDFGGFGAGTNTGIGLFSGYAWSGADNPWPGSRLSIDGLAPDRSYTLALYGASGVGPEPTIVTANGRTALLPASTLPARWPALDNQAVFPGLRPTAGRIVVDLGALQDPTWLLNGLELTRAPSDPHLFIERDRVTGRLSLRWASRPNMLYTLRSSLDLASPPSTWPVFDGREGIVATPPLNTLEVDLPSAPERFFAIEVAAP